MRLHPASKWIGALARHAATITLLTVLVLTLPARAHDRSLHKGKPVEGEAATIAADQLTLKTATATIVVVFDEQTHFERGDKPATKADLARGIHLTVFGTKLATGELVAREVLIGETHGAGAVGPLEPEVHGGHEH
jgi:hypothetical protein